MTITDITHIPGITGIRDITDSGDTSAGDTTTGDTTGEDTVGDDTGGSRFAGDSTGDSTGERTGDDWKQVPEPVNNVGAGNVAATARADLTHVRVSPLRTASAGTTSPPDR